jgi:hypothetical protein
MSKKYNDDVEIDIDSVEEVREVLKYAIESKSWLEAEDALGLLNEILGYENEDDEEENPSKRNHMEE